MVEGATGGDSWQNGCLSIPQEERKKVAPLTSTYIYIYIYIAIQVNPSPSTTVMGTAKKVRKFGAVKRLIGQNDARLKKNQAKGEEEAKKKEREAQVVREVPQVSSALFFQYNTALVPPYSILLDTVSAATEDGGFDGVLEFPLPYCTAQAPAAGDADGYALRQLHPHHNQLRNGYVFL
ncbi:rRNA-processing protein FCF1 [Diplocarpon rosae]|nr:rRNA-processing protein FCF1 [Diplocarpon rosae]